MLPYQSKYIKYRESGKNCLSEYPHWEGLLTNYIAPEWNDRAFATYVGLIQFVAVHNSGCSKMYTA